MRRVKVTVIPSNPDLPSSEIVVAAFDGVSPSRAAEARADLHATLHLPEALDLLEKLAWNLGYRLIRANRAPDPRYILQESGKIQKRD
jgi:hypothetical protein